MSAIRFPRMRHRQRWLILTAAALAVCVTAATDTLSSPSPVICATEPPPPEALAPCATDNITADIEASSVFGGEIADALSTFVENKEYEKPTVLHANRESPGTVALTFDDGPHPKLTAPILDLLAEYNIKATFFTIGMNAQTNPELVERELAEGHEIGNHTQTHPNLAALSYQEVYDEVLAAERAVFAENKYKTHLLRPPGGNVGENVMRLASNLNYDLILWSVDTRDWAHTDAATIVRNVSKNVKNGDVILFHDYVSGESHTLEALKQLIPELISRGYEFVTVSELFGLKQTENA